VCLLNDTETNSVNRSVFPHNTKHTKFTRRLMQLSKHLLNSSESGSKNSDYEHAHYVQVSELCQTQNRRLLYFYSQTQLDIIQNIIQ
jgi:hypothetical protein